MKQKEMRRIVEKYDGCMTDTEFHEEFGIPLSMLTRIREIIARDNDRKKHLCWDCKNATDMFKCVYVMSCMGPELRYFDGTKTESDGDGRVIITKCPQFKKG